MGGDNCKSQTHDEGRGSEGSEEVTKERRRLNGTNPTNESLPGEGIPCCICTSAQSALWSWLM